MSELQANSTGKRRISKKGLSRSNENSSTADFVVKSSEILASLKIIADFKSEDAGNRNAKFLLSKGSREKTDLPELVLNLFTLLHGNKRPNAKTLVRYLIIKNLISLSELKSLLPKNKSGRRKMSLNKKTGKIENAKEPFKSIYELYNQGFEPKEILNELIKNKIFPQYKSAKAKSNKISDIRRILRRRKDLLIRQYGQK